MNRVVVTAFLVLLSESIALAQLRTVTISGQVAGMDGLSGTGHPGIMRACKSTVVGAAVTVRETETNQIRVTTTGDYGSYRFDRLPVGKYEISVESQGLKTAVQSGLNLTSGASVVENSTLQIDDTPQMPQTPHMVPSGLQMSLSLDPQQDASDQAAEDAVNQYRAKKDQTLPPTPAIKVDLKNNSSSEMVIALDPEACHGSPIVVTHTIVLVLTDSHGKSAHLENVVHTSSQACSLIGSPYMLTLPPGATFSTPIHLDDYAISSRWSMPIMSYEIWHPGEIYSLQAELTVNGSESSGVLATSNQLQIHFPDN